MKMWWTVGLITGLGWPRRKLVMAFDGHPVHLLPGGETLRDGRRTLPTVGVAYDVPGAFVPPALETPEGEPRCASADDAIRVIKRFLSVVSWCTDEAIAEHGAQGGPLNNAIEPLPVQRLDVNILFDHYADCLPEPGDSDARYALAFYREGLTLESVPYRFLSFVKVLNLRLKDREQADWINDHLEGIHDPDAVHRVGVLNRAGENVGAYLYGSGRCAIAHALSEPRVDPDDPEHLHRLYEDLPLMKALARHFISTVLGVLMTDEVSRQRRNEP